MDREKAENEWREYLKGLLQGFTAAISFDDETGLPFLFAYPHCATCYFWYPIHRGGLNHLSNPDEIEYVEAGLQGKLLNSISLGNDHSDTYWNHAFFGWCKRYPPRHRDYYSIVGFRTLFTLVSRIIPSKIADYQFPVLSHINTCGEWKQGDWVEKFIKENKIEQ